MGLWNWACEKSSNDEPTCRLELFSQVIGASPILTLYSILRTKNGMLHLASSQRLVHLTMNVRGEGQKSESEAMLNEWLEHMRLCTSTRIRETLL